MPTRTRYLVSPDDGITDAEFERWFDAESTYTIPPPHPRSVWLAGLASCRLCGAAVLIRRRILSAGVGPNPMRHIAWHTRRGETEWSIPKPESDGEG